MNEVNQFKKPIEKTELVEKSKLQSALSKSDNDEGANLSKCK